VQGAVDAGIELLEKPFTEASLLARERHAIESGGEPAGPGTG